MVERKADVKLICWVAYVRVFDMYFATIKYTYFICYRFEKDRFVVIMVLPVISSFAWYCKQGPSGWSVGIFCNIEIKYKLFMFITRT